MKISPVDAETLRRAADVADAQMELVQAMKRRPERAAGRGSIVFIGVALVALSTISTVSLLWH